MTHPLPHPGRRANGLQASDWGALVDLDPRLSEGLLDRLAQAGVAAYVEPATAVDSVHRAVVMPGRPLDRLWVDPARADAAREVVASEIADLTALLAEDDPAATASGLVQPVPRNAARRVLPPPLLPAPPAPAPPTPPGPPSDDDVFAQIVAGYHADPGDEPPRWPAAEELPNAAPAPPDRTPPRRRRTDRPAPLSDTLQQPPPQGAGRPAPPEARRPGPAPASDQPAPPPAADRAAPPPAADRAAPPPAADRPVPSSGADRPGPSPEASRQPPRQEDGLPAWADPQAEDDDHFVPPPPPPVPRLRPRTLGAVLCAVLGVLVLFAPGALGLSATRGGGFLGLVLLAGGAGALVWWMRDSSPGGGPDDGAVV